MTTQTPAASVAGKAAPAGDSSPRASAGACLWVLEHDSQGQVAARCGERRLPGERLCADHYIAAVGPHHSKK